MTHFSWKSRAMLAFTVYCKFVLSGRILLYFAAIAGKGAFLP